MPDLTPEHDAAVGTSWLHTRDGSVCRSYAGTHALGSWWCSEHEQFVRLPDDASEVRS